MYRLRYIWCWKRIHRNSHLFIPTHSDCAIKHAIFWSNATTTTVYAIVFIYSMVFKTFYALSVTLQFRRISTSWRHGVIMVPILLVCFVFLVEVIYVHRCQWFVWFVFFKITCVHALANMLDYLFVNVICLDMLS